MNQIADITEYKNIRLFVSYLFNAMRTLPVQAILNHVEIN